MSRLLDRIVAMPRPTMSQPDAPGGQGSANHDWGTLPKPPQRTPAFNLPPSILWLGGFLVALQAISVFILDEFGRDAVLQWAGFIPQRLLHAANFDGGAWPLLWTPLTHAFMHANWEHLLFNLAWLAVFGTPVARRYGVKGLILIGGTGAICGAIGFTLFNLDGRSVMIGASGAISGLTGAAIRFVFQPIEVRVDPDTGERTPIGRRLLGIAGFARNRRALWLAIALLGVNFAVGIFGWLSGDPSQVAWQAHVAGLIGGFLVVGPMERRLYQP
jgi:membrane associated rhomboid family serine protease